MARDREQQIVKRMGRCSFFNGVQNKLCEASVEYDTLPKPGLPCLGEGDTCASRKFPDRATAEREVDEMNARLDEVLAGMRIGKCHDCGSMGTDWRQVGRCFYQEPCGHRVGQGDAAKYKQGVMEARNAK